MTVYLVSGLAFLVEYLLLLGTERCWGSMQDVGFCAAGALLGGLHTGLCLISGFRFLGSVFWRLVFSFLSGMIAYRGQWGKSLRFVLVLFGAGVLAEAVGKENLPAAGLAAMGLWLGCGGPASGNDYIPLELCREGKRLTMTALRDTGNMLRDPLTGEQVLVLSPEAAFALTGLTAQQLRSPLDTLAHRPIPGLKLIPYRAVGSSGFLLGLRFADAKIGGRRRSVVAAFAPEGLGRGDGYQALAGGRL